MSIKNNKKLILNKLKQYYGFNTNIEFANFLGIAPTTLSSWYARGTIDYDLIYAKCEVIDGNFLLTGEGPMLRDELIERKEKTAEKATQQAAVVSTCPQCILKDKIIESQEATILAQKETIELLKRELEQCGYSKKPPLPDTLPAEATAKLKKD